MNIFFSATILVSEVLPRAQNNHWLLSYQKEENGHVYVIDSLKSNRTVNANMSIQLSQLYHSRNNYLEIIVPDVQRQTISSECLSYRTCLK
jgi:hypothetical protein